MGFEIIQYDPIHVPKLCRFRIGARLHGNLDKMSFHTGFHPRLMLRLLIPNTRLLASLGSSVIVLTVRVDTVTMVVK